MKTGQALTVHYTYMGDPICNTQLMKRMIYGD